MDDGALESKCQEQGECNQRGESEIFQYVLMEPTCFAMLYINDSDGEVLDEELSLELQGLFVEGEGDNISIHLEPGQRRLIRFTPDPEADGIAFSYSVPSCSISPV